MRQELDSTEILGIPVARLTPELALEEIEALATGGSPATVFYANAHSLNLASSDKEYRDVLLRAALVLNDGAGIALAGRLQRAPFPANLNGSDFNPRIAELAAARGWSLYLLGARTGVADRAARLLSERIPGLTIAGARDGYFSPGEEASLIDAIKASRAEVLMVAMGNPRQELWLERNLAATGARIGVGVGAFFDFTAGVVARAPTWMNRLGVEWLFRLYQEPRRMWRRYALGNPLFLWRVLRARLRRH